MKQVFDTADLKWTREPATYKVGEDEICIVTDPHTDLWQRTYYRFRNDNAPVLQIETEEKFFSFVMKTDFSGSHHRFDQCGITNSYFDLSTGSTKSPKSRSPWSSFSVTS